MYRTTVRIAFVFIAEAYQVYHAAAIAFALAERPGVAVDLFHNDPATPHHLARIAAAHEFPVPVSQRLAPGLLGSLIQAPRLLGLAKPQVLAHNEALLSNYDAVISTEGVIGTLFGDRAPGQRPWRILIPHGGGDRLFPAYFSRSRCDFILSKGIKDVERELRTGVAQPGHIAAGGYPKLVTSARLRSTLPALFPVSRPTVLYNPHKVPRLGSWHRFIEPLLAAFSDKDVGMNLIVAPHVKMFRRRSPRLRGKWHARGSANILIDTGSDLLLDNSYTEAADIYLGDVSSQVYEFVARPRPCVFINTQRVDWREDPHFQFWQMGEVIEEPADLIPALRRAPDLHERFRARQIELATRALGDTSPHCITRSVDLVIEFIQNGRVAA